MLELTLYHSPGACSRVTMTALEHIGTPFHDVMIDLKSGEHKQPAFRATNPRGKVPALLADGKLLSENAAILLWLDQSFPEAGLLPEPADGWSRAQQWSDLFWLSSVWHPYVRANAMPVRWTTGDIASVRERGRELLTPCIEQLEQRLAEADWWYERWSIIDVYFYWAYITAEKGAFSLADYTNIARHRAAIEALPAYQRALEREQAAIERHEEQV